MTNEERGLTWLCKEMGTRRAMDFLAVVNKNAAEAGALRADRKAIIMGILRSLAGGEV